MGLESFIMTNLGHQRTPVLSEAEAERLYTEKPFLNIELELLIHSEASSQAEFGLNIYSFIACMYMLLCCYL